MYVMAVAILASAWTLAWAEPPNIIPTPQHYQAGTGSLVLVKEGKARVAVLLPDLPDRKEELAAGYIAQEIRRLAGVELPVLRNGAGSKAAARIRLGSMPESLPEADAVFLKSEKTGQGYVLNAMAASGGDGEVRIVGASPQGTLFGAMTLLQMLRREGADIVLDAAHIRDYPDFRERQVGGAYVSSTNALSGAREAVDFALRYKVNIVATATPRRAYVQNAESIRRITTYARERGIRCSLSLSMGVLHPDNAPTGKGERLLNRRSYPEGETYRCMFETEDQALWYCLSNDAKNKLEALHLAEYVRRMEPGHIQVHHAMDNSRWAIGGKIWSRRCANCRTRWPSDDLSSIEGLAGAEANYWNQVIEAIQSVRNADSGYDARRHLAIRIIPPIYCNHAEDDAVFDNEATFYRTFSAGLKHKENVFLATRELGRRNDSGRKRFMQMSEILHANGVQFAGWIWAGGRQEPGWPQPHRHYFWFSPLPAMLKAFEGADMLLVAGNDTLMAQLIGAEYSWNSSAPGFLDPADQRQYRAAFSSLGKSLDTPPEIYGTNGLIERICRNIGGAKAGTYLAKGFKSRRTIHGRRLTPISIFSTATQTIGPWEKACKDISSTSPRIMFGWAELWRLYAELGEEASACFRQAMEQEEYEQSLPYVRRRVALLESDVRSWGAIAAKNAVASETIALKLEKQAPIAAAEESQWAQAPGKPKGSAIEVGVFTTEAYRSIVAASWTSIRQSAPGLTVRLLEELTTNTLSGCDVLVLHASKALPKDWRVNVRRFAGEGRGVLLLHNAIGYRAFGASLFPEIVVGGIEHPQINRAKVVGRHAVTEGLADGTEFTHSYIDHILMQPGSKGVVVLGEAGTEIGRGEQPILVVGNWGNGRVACSGIFFGYNSAGEKADMEEGRILLNLISWLAAPRIEGYNP